MKQYELLIEDIYDRNKNKRITVKDVNVYMAHKSGLKYTNALREEISRINSGDRTVFTFKTGFQEEE
jgi:hypothetical protein